MTFEIGDKVATTRGLYMSGAWRDAGLKGKVVAEADSTGLLTVQFKGLEHPRFIGPGYLNLRKKKKRPFKGGDTVALKAEVSTNAGSFPAGAVAEVLGLIPDSNLVEIKFMSGTELTVAEEVLSKTEVVADNTFEVGDTVVFTKAFEHGMNMEVAQDVWAEVVKVHPKKGEVTVEFDDYTTLRVPAELLSTEDQYFAGEEKGTDEPGFDSEEVEPLDVQEALALVLERIEEIVTLLTTKPQHEVHIYSSVTNEASLVTPEAEEEPAPEPVFKKAKEVKAGDSLYTESGVWDKVDRIETKDSGYTSLFGMFGNKIAQVPSGRVVQVLEPVA